MPLLRNMTSLYLSCGEKMLLLYRQGSRVVNDVWTGSAGGHFEEYELNDPTACVLRELKEELSVSPEMISGLRLKYITLRYVNGEIRQNHYFFAEFPTGTDKKLSSDEGILKWFGMNEIGCLPMPYTSQYVIKHYLSEGRYDDHIYSGTADGSGIVFTVLSET